MTAAAALRRFGDVRRDVDQLANRLPNLEDLGQRGRTERLLHVLRVDHDPVGVHEAGDLLPFVAADQTERVDGAAIASARLGAQAEPVPMVRSDLEFVNRLESHLEQLLRACIQRGAGIIQ